MAGLLLNAAVAAALSRSPAAADTPAPPALPQSNAGALRAATVVLTVAAFIAAVDVVGFFLAAAVLLVVLLLQFGTQLPRAVAIALLAAGTVSLLFAGVLRVPLPRGLWLDG